MSKLTVYNIMDNSNFADRIASIMKSNLSLFQDKAQGYGNSLYNASKAVEQMLPEGFQLPEDHEERTLVINFLFAWTLVFIKASRSINIVCGGGQDKVGEKVSETCRDALSYVAFANDAANHLDILNSMEPVIDSVVKEKDIKEFLSLTKREEDYNKRYSTSTDNNKYPIDYEEKKYLTSDERQYYTSDEIEYSRLNYDN